MGRMKPAWYYERQAQEATARANYYRNRVPSVDTTVKSRQTTSAFYRSLLNKNGTEHLFFKVAPANAAVGLISIAQAGLLTTLPVNTVAQNMRGSGLKPSKISWYKGDATPVAERTPYNTRWIRYYSTAGTQSHFSVPFSRAAAEFDAQDLITAYQTIFTGGGRDTLLGTVNGRSQLFLERRIDAVQT